MEKGLGVKKNMRQVKSYVLRRGRMTAKQREAVGLYWEAYGVDLVDGKKLDFLQLFGNDSPVVMDIGFGMGDTLVAAAESDPERNYLGVEVHYPGVGSILNQIRERELTNIKVVQEDAVKIVSDYLEDAQLAECSILFPDPWHKKKHNKRRLINQDFLDLVGKKLKPQGALLIATDWLDYAQQCVSLLEAHPLFNRFDSSQAGGKSALFRRKQTKFETRGLRLGHKITNIDYMRIVD
jgi:tRNA (guanine-N7-)-methyltransferase